MGNGKHMIFNKNSGASGLIAGLAFAGLIGLVAATEAAAQRGQVPVAPQNEQRDRAPVINQDRDFTPAPPLSLKSDFLGYSFSVSPRVTYSDNNNLASDVFIAENDGFDPEELIFSTLTTANAIVSSRRFTGLLSADLDLSYLSDSEDLVVNQRVGAAGTATIAENLFYVDVAGGSARFLIGENAAFSLNQNAARNERANVYTGVVSPYLFREFDNRSSIEVRYRYQRSFVDDSNSNAVRITREQAEGLPGFDPSDFNDFLNDSRSHEALARYESGRLFDRLAFAVTGYANQTDDTGSDFIQEFSFNQFTGSLEAQYALSRKFSLSGAIGYDEIDTDGTNPFFDDDDLSGVYWRAGFIARPGPRTRAQIEYGRRFDDDFIQADLRYQLGRRFLFTAGASRTFQTRSFGNAQTISQNSREILRFADRLRNGGEENPRQIIDQSVQLAGIANGGLSAQVNGIGPTNNANVRLSGQFDKTVVTLSGFYQDSDFGFREFESFNAGIDVTHNLTAKLSVFGSAIVRVADDGFDVNNCVAEPELFLDPVALQEANFLESCTELTLLSGESTTFLESVGLTYQLGRRARAFGQYSRSDRVSGLEGLEFTENAITAGVIFDF